MSDLERAIVRDAKALELLQLVDRIERDVRRVRAYPLFPLPKAALDRVLQRLKTLRELIES